MEVHHPSVTEVQIYLVIKILDDGTLINSYTKYKFQHFIVTIN